MKTSLKLVAGVAEEPLSTGDAKKYLRVYGSDEDAVVGQIVTAARLAVENEIGRPIGEQTFELGMQFFPGCGVIEVPRPPLISVLSIKYQKQDLSWVTLVDSEASPAVTDARVLVEISGIPGTIHLRSGYSWPSDVLAEGFPVRVKFTAGITDNAENLLTLIGLAAAYMFEHRDEDGGDGVRVFIRKMAGLADKDICPEMN